MALCSPGKLRCIFHQYSVFRYLNLSAAAAAAMKNHLPDRWTDYNPVGRRIPGTRFIAFKVPLNKIFDTKLTPCQRFSPADLVSEVEKQNEHLGLIVDLTFTKRYYSPRDLPKSVLYCKVFTAGHQVPTNEVIHEFKSIVQRFISENSDNEKLIGVHCTHGLNRTGYLVCRYMIDVLGMEPSDAIEKFNKSRGHCIERPNYLEDLLHGDIRAHPCNSNLGPPSNYPKNLNPPTHQTDFPHAGESPSCHPPNFNSGPPSSYRPKHYPPTHQREFTQTGGRPPGRHPAPNRWSSSVYPMSGPRHHAPQMGDGVPHHFRNGPRHPRFPRHQEDWPINGAPAEDFSLHEPQLNGGIQHHSSDVQGYGSQRHDPYRRHRGQGHRGNSRNRWQ